MPRQNNGEVSSSALQYADAGVRGGLCRYEDNGDAVTNLVVTVNKTDKSSIGGYGSPEKFLQDNSFLLGQQTFTGALRSGVQVSGI